MSQRVLVFFFYLPYVLNVAWSRDPLSSLSFSLVRFSRSVVTRCLVALRLAGCTTRVRAGVCVCVEWNSRLRVFFFEAELLVVSLVKAKARNTALRIDDQKTFPKVISCLGIVVTAVVFAHLFLNFLLVTFCLARVRRKVWRLESCQRKSHKHTLAHVLTLIGSYHLAPWAAEAGIAVCAFTPSPLSLSYGKLWCTFTLPRCALVFSAHSTPLCGELCCAQMRKEQAGSFRDAHIFLSCFVRFFF